MINVLHLVIFAILGIGLGVLYGFLVIRNYPENKRKFGYAIAVIIFLIVTVALYAIFSVKNGVNIAVKEYSYKLEQDIKEKNPNNAFVKNGLDIAAISGDASQLNSAVAEIKKLLPSHTELGISKFTYNFAVDYLTKYLNKGVAALNKAGKLASSFADENNFITLTSLINGLQKRILNIANIVFLVFAAIFAIILVIYIIRSLAAVKDAKSQTA